MATILLQAAGGFLGGMLGPVGAAIGSAAGAMAGYAVDRAILDGMRRVEGPRLSTMRPFMAEEGVPLPRVYGTVRIGGNLIWATRFQEVATMTRQGGKGGPRVTNYAYFANAAFALCEGEIAGIRRIWADGREIDRENVELRVYHGGENQPADPLIAAKQSTGRAPAYRGTAYVVLDRFPIGDYGNRLPQFQFEVLRACAPLNEEIRAITLIPGATEYGLSPSLVTRARVPGENEPLNRRVLYAGTDLAASLDELQALCPNLKSVALVATWFGTDLRAGHCRIVPGVADADPAGLSREWSVSGTGRTNAHLVSRAEGGAAYGGTPSDRSVIEAIGEIRARGLKVVLHPFIMMDVPAENTLPDPYGGTNQSPYPWRGRITCHPAPGMAGSTDGSASARAQVTAFCGGAQPAHFAPTGDGIGFSGPAQDWGYRRLVLHYARLSLAAGGVDGFLLGSEMRGVSRLRDAAGAFPFVDALRALAADVKAMLGAQTSITYGADWSEYFGHQPADGSGDAIFHLDPLWSHPAISAIGIDNYMPLSDWRDEDHDGGNPDGFEEPHDEIAMARQIAAGEGFDWYYASEADRAGRLRSPIGDGAYGKHWVFRYKDIVSWWSNPHHDRIAGVENAAPTGWVPRSKPIWFTELGCPAVDKGPNQPNVFPDPKSAESAIPYFSDGGRCDEAQERFLLAHHRHWGKTGSNANPVSALYGGPMVDPDALFVWTWDARPFPAFPLDLPRWSDGRNWQSGHWVNGRLSTVSVEALIAAILRDHGLQAGSVRAQGRVAGYVVSEPTTARAALEPLAEFYGVSVSEQEGLLHFASERRARPLVAINDLAIEPGRPVIEKVRAHADDLPVHAELVFADPMNDHQQAVARAQRPGGGEGRTRALGFSGGLETGAAEAMLADWVERRWIGRDTIGFCVPASRIDIEPGAGVTLRDDPHGYLVTGIEEGLVRRVRARRIDRRPAAPWRHRLAAKVPAAPIAVGAPHALFLDLPVIDNPDAPQDSFRVAAHMRPWRSQIVYAAPQEEGFAETAVLNRRAAIGRLLASPGPGREGRIDPFARLDIELFSGELASISMEALLNGGNLAAIRAESGQWEVLQFGGAEEIEPGRWRLSRLLRGQFGTGDAMTADAASGAPFVLLDERVPPAGLAGGLIGIHLNWRVAPAGMPVGADRVATHAGAGGLRALTPLSPVHLRMDRAGAGALRFSWTRRGRINADSWLGEDVPLAEEREEYALALARPGQVPAIELRSATPWRLFEAGELPAAFGSLPAQLELTVRQVSLLVGPGLPATRVFTT